MNDSDAKPWWQSTTIWSGIGSVIVAGAGIWLQAPVGANDVVDGATAAGQIAAGALGLLAIYGRLRAARRIG